MKRRRVFLFFDCSRPGYYSGLGSNSELELCRSGVLALTKWKKAPQKFAVTISTTKPAGKSLKVIKDYMGFRHRGALVDTYEKVCQYLESLGLEDGDTFYLKFEVLKR